MSSNPIALGIVRAQPGRSRLYPGMAVLCALVVLAGFAPTYYLRAFSDRPPLSLLLQLHGLAFSAWFVLFAVQSLLVRQRRLALHRSLGMLGAVLAVAMVYLGGAVAISQAGIRYAAGRTIVGFPPLHFLALQLGDLLQFAAFVIVGVALRRRPEAHKRLLLLATLTIVAPAIARLPLPPAAKFVLPVLLLLGCIGWDLIQRRRLHPAFLWGGLAFLVSSPLRVLIGGTAAWTALARWMVS